VHHVGILYGQFMMHGQRNIKLGFLSYSFQFTNSLRSNHPTLYSLSYWPHR